MKQLLLATTLAWGLTAPASAATIASLGVNPTSSAGAFSNAPGGGAFSDQFTFTLTGGPQFLSIASVTNTFANPSDFIAGFSGAVWTTGADGIVNNADDVAVIGPVGASACPVVPNCQFAAGSALLNPGAYYLEISGLAGGTAGYGGNLAVAAVPGPLMGAGSAGLLAGVLALWGYKRHRRASLRA